MALEDFVSVAIVLLTFIPLIIGVSMSKKGELEQILSWFLYWLTILFVFVDTHLLRKILERAFGALPTTLELDILNALDLLYKIQEVLLIVFGAIALLSVILLAFFAVKTYQTKPEEDED